MAPHVYHERILEALEFMNARGCQGCFCIQNQVTLFSRGGPEHVRFVVFCLVDARVSGRPRNPMAQFAVGPKVSCMDTEMAIGSLRGAEWPPGEAAGRRGVCMWGSLARYRVRPHTSRVPVLNLGAASTSTQAAYKYECCKNSQPSRWYGLIRYQMLRLPHFCLGG